MARTLKSDKPLFLLTLLLVGAGLVLVYSATAAQALTKHHNQYYFLYRQALYGAVGLAGLFVAMRVDYREYRRPVVIWSLLGVSVVTLLAVFYFDEVNGAKRWLQLEGVSFQPSELAKLAAVIFTAAVLERRMHRITDLTYALLPVALMCLVLVGLVVVEPDLGTSAVILLAVTAMVFAAGFQYRYLIVTMAVLVSGAVALIAWSPYRRARALAFYDPWTAAQGAGYQIIQSLLAIGSGGLLGRGLMQGVQKLYYLPEPHTDFIYSVAGEEFGLLGTTLMLACFALIAWRGLRIALLAPDRFGSLLALGITLTVTIQALMNISVVTKLMPTKGIPLPFVSNGGSSLVMSMIAIGILLNISQHSTQTSSAIVPGHQGWTLGEQEA